MEDSILEDRYNLNILLICSIYDTNPVHVLITVTENIVLTTTKKEKLDKDNKAYFTDFLNDQQDW